MAGKLPCFVLSPMKSDQFVVPTILRTVLCTETPDRQTPERHRTVLRKMYSPVESCIVPPPSA